MKKRVRKTYGPCRLHCGRDATHKREKVCDPCASGCRYWSNVKSPEERADYAMKLVTRMRRVDAVNSGSVVIGTSPYDWRSKPDVKVVPLFRTLERSLGRKR